MNEQDGKPMDPKDPEISETRAHKPTAAWKRPFHLVGSILGAILVLPVGWPLQRFEGIPDGKHPGLKEGLLKFWARLRQDWGQLARWKKWSSAVLFIVFLFWSLRLPSPQELKKFNDGLLLGIFDPPTSGYFSSWRVFRDRSAAKELLRALAKDNADPEALKDKAERALSYAAVVPDDVLVLAALARWHAWRDERLAFECLSQRAVRVHPGSLLANMLVPEVDAAYCQESVAASEQCRAILEGRLSMLRKVTESGRTFKFMAKGFDLGMDEREVGLSALPPFYADKKAWDAALDETRELYAKVMSREAFWRFLQDPFEGGPLAEDTLESLKIESALDLEQKAVLADWHGETSTAHTAYQAALAIRPQDLGLRRRYADYQKAWQAGPDDYKRKVERLRQFDPLHPKPEPKVHELEDAKGRLHASSTEPNAGPGQARQLEEEINDGEANLGDHESAAEFIFPTNEELRQWTEKRTEKPHWLRPCPIVLPFEDEEGKRLAMGGFLAFLSMQKAAFAPQAVFSIGNASSLYFQQGLFQPGLAVPVTQWSLLQSEWGADTVIRVRVRNAGTKIKASITWIAGEQRHEAQLILKAHHMQVLPGKVAEQIQAWADVPLTKVQRAYVAHPEFHNEAMLLRAFEAEQIYRGSMAHAWDWKAIHEEEPNSSLAVSRWVSVQQNDYQTGFQQLLQWLSTRPDEDYVRIQAAVIFGNWSRPHKVLEVLTPLLDRDLGHRWALYQATKALESLDAWSQVRQLWAGALKNPQRRPGLVGKYGSFLVDYAWNARGNGWGKDVGEWNARLFQVRLEKAQAELTKEMEAKNPDPEVYTTLMTTVTGLNQDASRMDATFSAAEKNCPTADAPYQRRLTDMMKKWHGSDEAMFAFAEKNKKDHPALMISAYDEVYFRARTNEPHPNSFAPEILYIRSLKDAWKNIDAAFALQLERNPDDGDLWENYLRHANWLDQTQAGLARLNSMSKTSSLLARVRPRLAAQCYWYLWDIGGLHDAQWPAFMAEIELAMAAEPHNRFSQNYYAKQMAGAGRWKLTRKLFDAIGEERVPLVWNAMSFADKRRKAFGPEGQVER